MVCPRLSLETELSGMAKSIRKDLTVPTPMRRGVLTKPSLLNLVRKTLVSQIMAPFGTSSFRARSHITRIKLTNTNLGKQTNLSELFEINLSEDVQSGSMRMVQGNLSELRQ